MAFSEAIAAARTGDVIVLRGGTYRIGGLRINQGITIQPFSDEQPVLKGSWIADKWQDLGNGLWTTTWPRLFPSRPADWWRRNREGKITPLYRFNDDMVFIDGRFLQAVGWEGEVDENSYYIDYDTGTVYIGSNPANHLVEITAYDCALLRTTREVHGKKSDGRGYTIRGITFSQYAYRALEIEGTEPEGLSPEAHHGKEVVGTTLENCTISFCSRVAGYLRGDHMTIRNCRISDTSTEGLYIISSNDVLLEKNIFTRNNIENITGYYPAAVKIFNQCHRVTCRDNLVIDLPNSNGIWYDVGNVDGVFVNNWLENVGRTDKKISTDQLWPSDNAFFFEISKGAICAGNIFVNCDHGLLVLNSSDVHIYNNTFVNSMACIGRNARSAQGDHFGWHPSTGPDVDQREGHVMVNNLFASTAGFARPLLFVWQPAQLCEQLDRPMLKMFDHNVCASGDAKGTAPLLLWSPARNATCQIGCESLADFARTVPAFAAANIDYFSYDGPLFKGLPLGRFELSPASPAAKAGIQPPASILGALGLKNARIRYAGASPVAP
jgi:hypothetical protein